MPAMSPVPRLIIHPVSIRAENNDLLIVAPVTAPALFPRMPRNLYYRAPGSYRDYLSTRNDAHVVALFLVALWHGLDMEIQGPISARLLRGLNELQPILLRLFRQVLKPITLHAAHLLDDAPKPWARGVAAPFSGGGDSFYTLWSHLPQNDPDPQTQLTHGIFVYGFDIRDPQNFETCFAAYRALFHRLGLELLTVSTNLRAWYVGMEWGWTYFAPVLTPALILDQLIGRVHMPANSVISDAPPWGEYTLLDRFLSTGSVEVADDGVTTTKAQKLAALAHWDATYDHLRVCYKKINGLENCCRCGKCLNTMIALELAGTLSRYKTFPLPLTRAEIRGMHIPKMSQVITQTSLAQARAQGRNDIVLDMSLAFALSRVRWNLSAARDTMRRRLPAA